MAKECFLVAIWQLSTSQPLVLVEIGTASVHHFVWHLELLCRSGAG
jgi:hypothetical protein